MYNNLSIIVSAKEEKYKELDGNMRKSGISVSNGFAISKGSNSYVSNHWIFQRVGKSFFNLYLKFII